MVDVELVGPESTNMGNTAEYVDGSCAISCIIKTNNVALFQFYEP